MGLLDIEGFGEKESIDDIEVTGETFKENKIEDYITGDIDYLLKYDIINKKYNLGKLLNGMGYNTSYGTMFCPFHDDKAGGKPSAKYHEDSDKLYCFSEHKMYTSYHALKYLYNQDMDKVFNDIWRSMSVSDRDMTIRQYENKDMNPEVNDTEWEKYQKMVLDKFKTGEVTYIQYKNALYKVLDILYPSSSDM
jgi:hypothetical protein